MRVVKDVGLRGKSGLYHVVPHLTSGFVCLRYVTTRSRNSSSVSRCPPMIPALNTTGAASASSSKAGGSWKQRSTRCINQGMDCMDWKSSMSLPINNTPLPSHSIAGNGLCWKRTSGDGRGIGSDGGDTGQSKRKPCEPRPASLFLSAQSKQQLRVSAMERGFLQISPTSNVCQEHVIQTRVVSKKRLEVEEARVVCRSSFGRERGEDEKREKKSGLEGGLEGRWRSKKRSAV